ncbi:MAG: diguanylate cyclase, partial [Butyrivibrio sp.]|nr:diguanylate cyclase [Butyrivibrio sp.]
MNTPNLYSMVQLEDGWTICRDGETKENVTLSEASIGIMNDNDVISISRVLPEVNSPSPCLSFRSLLSTIKVYINDELYYTYGQDFREKGDMLPKAYHYIPIDKIEENMTITIEYTATEDNAFSGLGEFYIGDRTDIENMYIQTKRMPFFISVFLIMFSFILIILTPALFSTGYKNPGIIFNALISYCLGSYILCYNDIIFFFTDYYYFGTVLEYISLFMVPFSTMGYLLFTGKQFDTVVTRTMMVIDTIFVFLVSVLHFTNSRHFNHYVIYMHVISLIEGIYIIYSLIKFIIVSKRNDTENISLVSSYFLAYGLIFLVICAIIDIFKFNFEKMLGSSGDLSSNISFITLGALAFVITLLLSYLFHCIEYIGSNRIKQHLVGLAYTDELTGLANRAKCEQTLVSLNKQNKNYYIISLDLDNLKPVNDNFGHLEGDHLIMDFAEILKNSFENAHLLG